MPGGCRLLTKPYKVGIIVRTERIAMNAKLTLKLDSDIIERAKVYAERQGVSLSRMVESYFLGLTQGVGSDESRPRGVVAELAGLLAGAEVNEKEDYAEYLAKKYS
jgi:hypothetical protein